MLLNSLQTSFKFSKSTYNKWLNYAIINPYIVLLILVSYKV